MISRSVSLCFATLLCAALVIFSISSTAVTQESYNDPNRSLPRDTKSTLTQPNTSEQSLNDSLPGTSGVGRIGGSLSAQPPVRSYPNTDCASDYPPQTYYYELPVNPAKDTYVRVTFRGSTKEQRERIVIWSGTTPVAQVSVVGWQDANVFKWPGGEFRYHVQDCVDYAFHFYATSWKDISPGGKATSSSGLIRIFHGPAGADIEWGPQIQPPTPPEPTIRLRVGYQKACKGVNLLLVSGYVATNYGRAWAVASDGTTPVVVKSLKVSIVYDGPSFPLTRNPTLTAMDQASVETSEQLRAIGLGWQASDVCRGFKVVADLVTYGGRTIHHEIHTK
jgi:hypothetical protein